MRIVSLRTVRLWAVPAAGAVLALMLVAAAARSSYKESLQIDVKVISTADGYDIGAITSAKVELTNHGQGPIRPLFSLVWEPQPARWRIVEGPTELPPGSRAVYRIEAIAAITAPPLGQPFQVRVSNPGSIVYAVSKTVETKKADLLIPNPGLRFWTEQDPVTRLSGPLGWYHYERRGDGDETVVERSAVSGHQAVLFHVLQDGDEDPGSWTHTGIIQSMPFPKGPLAVETFTMTPFKAIAGGWPLNAFGLEVADAENPLLWILLQPTETGALSYDLPSGHHIEVLNVPAGEWTSVEVDLLSLYRQLGWHAPDEVVIKIFAAAASVEPQEVNGYIARIGPVQ